MSEQTLSVQHPDMETKSSGTSRWKGWIGGIFFTFVIAVLGYGLSHLSGFDRIGPLASAIVIAVTFRQFSGYPESIRSGIQFSSKKLLRIAIVLYGLRLNIEVVLHDGLPLLVRGAGTILFAIGLTLLLARWLKANTTVSLLLGVGTGVCGAAAIAAVSPILKTEDEDTAISVGIIALVGTVFAIGYTLIKPLMPWTVSHTGSGPGSAFMRSPMWHWPPPPPVRMHWPSHCWRNWAAFSSWSPCVSSSYTG